TLHIDQPTPHVDWTTGNITLLTHNTPWPHTNHPRRAAISSFGISGTNAHLILEQAESQGPAAEEPPAPSDDRTVPWVLSARSDSALRARASELAARVAADTSVSTADIGWSLAAAEPGFEHRAVVVGTAREELLAALGSLADGPLPPPVAGGAAAQGPVLVFPGQGSQWAGMGGELLESFPVFAARIAECEQALAPYVDWSLTEVLRGTGSAADLTRVDVVQPALWAVMVSLAALWHSFGITPAAVVGHSQGEIAAACVAGALSL
ncbi:acyltransferase domain-containing protein, partial [Streptomyces palmae]